MLFIKRLPGRVEAVPRLPHHLARARNADEEAFLHHEAQLPASKPSPILLRPHGQPVRYQPPAFSLHRRAPADLETFRVNARFVLFLENIFRIILYLTSSLYGKETLLLSGIALPAVLLGMKAGGVDRPQDQ